MSTGLSGEEGERELEIRKATEELAAFLQQHDIKVYYVEQDWKDMDDLLADAIRMNEQYPTWSYMYMSGDTWGIDSNFVFFTSKQVDVEVVEKIGNYIYSQGAELPGDAEPKYPHCPKCGAVILEALPGSYDAEVGSLIGLSDGKLSIIEDDVGPISEEGSGKWWCPSCEKVLFRSGQEPEILAFLMCRSDYTWREPPSQEVIDKGE